MLKIGLLSPFLPEKDGIAIYSNNFLRGFKSKSEQIITIGRRGSKADYLVNFKSFSLRKNLEKIIKKEKLRLVHIQYVATLFGKYNLNLNLINALKLQVPVIVTLHEVQYSTKGLKNKILSSIEHSIVKRADKIIVHTVNQKRFLEKKHRTKNIVHIYQGLNLYRVNKKVNKNLLFFGMISKGKGLKYLIRAMQCLPDYKLRIAGRFVDRRIEQEIKNELKKSCDNIKTEFGWADDSKKRRFYKNSDLVVLPYTWAPYQSAIMHDAISWELPLVVTKVGALHEIVKQFGLGEVVRAKNPDAIAEGVRKVFKDYSHYKKGVLAYRKKASWDKTLEECKKVYKEVLQ